MNTWTIEENRDTTFAGTGGHPGPEELAIAVRRVFGSAEVIVGEAALAGPAGLEALSCNPPRPSRTARPPQARLAAACRELGPGQTSQSNLPPALTTGRYRPA